jgi:hypothetical protein
MAGRVPAIFVPADEARMAGTRPAMTMKAFRRYRDARAEHGKVVGGRANPDHDTRGPCSTITLGHDDEGVPALS